MNLRRGRFPLRIEPSRVCGLLALVVVALAPMGARAGQPVHLVYADWSSSVASAHLVCAVVHRHLDRRCTLEQVSAEQMYERVAEGEADAMLSAWLPDTHRHYVERYGDRLQDLGPNFEGTRIGLVVPAVSPGRQTGPYGARGRGELEVDSIAELNAQAERFGGRIVGIEADTGIMRATREAMAAYELDDFRLVEGSEASMTASLQEAIQRKEPIVVTGWQPHWLFGRWALRFLADPKGVYGREGRIHTLVRPGLRGDMPEVYALVDRFYWRAEELGQLMVWIQADAGRDPGAQVERWLRTHPELIEAWLPEDR